jgi:hypothetical protein
MPAESRRPDNRDMNFSLTLPSTVQIKRTRLVGLLAAVAVLASALTWAAVSATSRTAAKGTQLHFPTSAEVLASLTPAERRYVEGVIATPADRLAAVFGNRPVVATTEPPRVHLPTRVEVMAPLDPATRRYVEGLLVASPAQLAAAFGYGPLRTSG